MNSLILKRLGQARLGNIVSFFIVWQLTDADVASCDFHVLEVVVFCCSFTQCSPPSSRSVMLSPMI
jgi:hypothetical protein